MTRLPDHSAPHVVVPVMAGIGNAVMTVPLVRQLKRANPAGRLTVLARNGVIGDVFRRLAEVDAVRVTGTRPGTVLGVQRMRDRPDVYVIPYPSNRWQYSMLAATSGAGRTIMHGYPTGGWRAMHALARLCGVERVPAERGLHDVRQNLNLLPPLGVEPDHDEAPAFAVTDADRAAADRMLAAAGLSPGERPIAVHAGCGKTVLAAAKRWPPEQFGPLVRHLEQRFGPRIVLLEGPDERGVAAEILPHALPARPMILPLSGPLGEAAAVLERSELYIGSDSGLAHLSAAVGTPPVTLFAPADPDRVCPFGWRHTVVQPSPPPRGAGCTPCLAYPLDSPYPKVRCRPPMCIESIRREQILAAVDRAIGEASGDRRGRLRVLDGGARVGSEA